MSTVEADHVDEHVHEHVNVHVNVHPNLGAEPEDEGGPVEGDDVLDPALIPKIATSE